MSDLREELLDCIKHLDCPPTYVMGKPFPCDCVQVIERAGAKLDELEGLVKSLDAEIAAWERGEIGRHTA